MKFIQSLTLLILLSFGLSAQINDLRFNAKEKRSELSSNGFTTHIEAANIGPTIFSGRISDIAVNPENPEEFYAAYASGGLWYTKNNGTTFSPVFDNEAVITIGDVVVDWKNNIIWLGTGEVNSSRSSYAGVGIYKSLDMGKSWLYMGLPESHHIGRIILHPSDPNVAWVAALGHLYSTNSERGVYKTIDGGETWAQTLFVNDNSGAVDLIIDENNPDILYAASWDRIRKAWDFQESGLGSGIYKSEDGGVNWTKLNIEGSGFPYNEGTGRIGLDIAQRNDTTFIYAILDNYNRRPAEEKKDEEGLTKNSFTEMTSEDFGKLNEDDLQKYLENNNFPDKYKAAEVQKMVSKGLIKPLALKEYVEDANSLLFDTPVIAAEVYLSIDNGVTWKKTHDYYLDGLYNSYGYYFGQVKVNPKNPDQLYIMGVPILRSDDGGKNWKNIDGDNVHADHHALWINPKQTDHIINGNDGGINISYDAGDSWIKCNMPAVGQFYYINVDNADPYNVYGGVQDNGVWVGSNSYNAGSRWQMNGDYPYDMLMGGDGMQVQIDNRDNNTVYTGFQFGNYFRIDKSTGSRSYITPKHELGDRPYRWNWQTPILLSSHHQDILYMGCNKLLRSMDQGKSFKEISDDLTTGGKIGDVAFGTLTTISESRLKFGLIYTGSDDGKVFRTKDGGNTWTDIGGDLPSDKWVSRIIASSHNESRVFLSLNGYRDDDFVSYVYKSEDYGDTWESIGFDLPSEPVNVIKEDHKNENLIFVGTDHGAYASVDMGQNYMLLSTDMPRVPVHDLVIQERENHLLIGTHGRSIFKADISGLQQIEKGLESGLHIYQVSTLRERSDWGKKRRPYSEPNVPNVEIEIFATEAGNAVLSIWDEKVEIMSMEVEVKKGFSKLKYDASIDISKKKKYEKHLNKDSKTEKAIELNPSDNGSIYLRSGEYEVKLIKGDITAKSVLKIK